MNASPDESSLNALVDNNTVASNIAYGTSSSYVSVSSGSHTLEVEPSSSSSVLLSQSLSVSSGSNTTVLAGNFSSSINFAIYTDDNSSPSSSDIKLRIINASPSLGTADVYVVAPGTDLNTVNATVSNLPFEGASSYQSLAAGSWEVEFTLPGAKFPYIDSGSLSLTAGQIRTVVGLNSESGGFTAAVLADKN
jgi:hypothetical protein